MAQIHPFSGIRYSRQKDLDFSNLIAPPYDVLDDAGKAALQARDPHNIVTVDLPHLPAKSVGPDETYARANTTLQQWLVAGMLQRDAKPALYPYSQTYQHGGRSFHRRGLIAAVRLSPFGQGQVVPHEKTYPEAIQDRLKLTRATGMQLSPIFGLFSDPNSEITNQLYHEQSKPEISANLNGVQNDLWTVIDSSLENRIMDLMAKKPVYIADGHHRYTMALQYQAEQQQANGGQLPPNHPANFCMFVLVGMQDDGLLILPTHRLVGGLTNFNIAAFTAAAEPLFQITATSVTPDKVAEFIDVTLPKQPANTFGLYDAKTRQILLLRLKDPDVLKKLEPDHSDPYRHLDVVVLQRCLLDEIIKPKFAGGNDPTKGYTADSAAVVPQTDGAKYQIALMLKATPLHALEELGKTNEVMPQKSTYFYPKLATGMVIYPLS